MVKSLNNELAHKLLYMVLAVSISIALSILLQLGKAETMSIASETILSVIKNVVNAIKSNLHPYSHCI